MKKTLTVNLNGRVFNIDEDAYQLLDNYLRNLRIYFRNEEGHAEILADFEARIEELLSDRVRLGYDVISIEEIEKVIAQMGRPGDFGENETPEDEAQPEEKREESYIGVKKKFYRNPGDKMFAGICSGVAAYFGWNVLIVRIIAAILVPATSLWIVPAYLILWLVVPEATTAEQKLEMQGKPITVENIGKTVAAGVEEVKKATANSGCLASLVDFIVAFFKVCLVGLGCLIGIPLIFALVIVIIVLFATLFGVGTGVLGGLIPWTNETFLFVEHPAVATVCFCFITGIPLIALVYTIISHLFKLKPVHKGVKWTGIILWIAALVALPFSGFKSDWTKISHGNHWNFGYSTHNNYPELHGNGILADRTEALSPIEYISIKESLIANLQIEQVKNGETSLVINGDSNLINKVKVEVKEDGTLSLSTVDHFQLRPSTHLIIRLQTPDLHGLKVESVGNVNIPGAFSTTDFYIRMEGAGTVQADSLYSSTLKVTNEGVGSVVLAGTAKNTTFDLQGVGSINAVELVSDSVTARMKGVGSIRCNPVQYLDGEVNGIGTITYKSEPIVKRITVNGIGKIKLD
jgi:phage shock protein PspC (stress-responsive transcriptional regulator)